MPRRSADKTPAWVNGLAASLFNVAQSKVAAAVDTRAPRRIMDQLSQWIGHLTRNAAVRWTPSLLGGETCAFCNEDALNHCIVCGDPCCLGHAHVSYRAELVCDECIADVLEKKANPTAEQAAFAYFNLTQHASLQEVTAVYRLRARSAHPDQGGSQQAMVETTRHFEVLKDFLQRRAA